MPGGVVSKFTHSINTGVIVQPTILDIYLILLQYFFFEYYTK